MSQPMSGRLLPLTTSAGVMPAPPASTVAAARPGTATPTMTSHKRVAPTPSPGALSVMSTRSHRTRSARHSTRGSIRETFRARSSSIEFFIAEVRSAFDPNSRAIHIWHQLLLMCLIYEIMVLPVLVIFRPSLSGIWLHPELIGIYVCELLFLADVYVELNTGYYEDGNVTLDAKKSRVKYVKSARFLLDILALPPLSLLNFDARDVAVSPAFFEFHKFLRIWRLPKYVAMLDDIYARYFVVLKMFKVLLVIILLSHYVACFRFLFGYDVHHNNHWLPHMPSDDHVVRGHSQYLMSLFWAFGLLTGLFEGELPHTIWEFLFTIFVALCGFSLFTYLCATFFMISKCESGRIATAEAGINQLKHLLSFHQVPESLQIQAIEYLKRYYTHSESNDREAMRLLCPSIAKDIQVALLKEMVGNILFFRDCNEQFIIAVTSLLELISLPANIVVFNAGDEGDAMYVVNSGVLHVIARGIKIREVRKGAFFGEMALFLKRPRYATVVTSTYCTLYKLVRFHVERLLEGYPEYAKAIPERVEEMARALFGRVSGEAMMIPDEHLIQEAIDANKGAEKNRFATLIRKHIKKDKPRVAPNGGGNGEGVTQTAMMLLADALRKSRQMAGQSEATTKGEDSLSANDNERKSKAESVDGSTRVTEAITNVNDSNVMSRRPSATSKVVKALAEIYTQMGWSASGARKRYWWSSLLLITAIDFDSRRRIRWLAVIQGILIYNWFLIPLQLSFQALRHSTWYIVTLNIITDLLLWVDIYGNFNLSFVENSEKIWDTTRTALRYFRGWFLFDMLSVFPYWFFATSAHHAIPRIPRLLRVLRVRGHFVEIDDFLKLNSKQRLLLFGVLLVVLYHVVACLHFSVTYVEGFSHEHDAWIPSDDVYLIQLNESYYIDGNNYIYFHEDPHVISIGVTQYFRSLYYAANVLTALGRTIEPASDVQYGVALVFMLSGFFITAIVVDNVQKRFTASAFEQKEFFARRSHIQLFLRRQNAPLVIHKRVNAFLDFWWSSHRGAVINELLEELPETIKLDILQSICQPALQTLALLNGVRPVLNELERVFLDNVKFILYGQGEIIYRQGDYASGLFFLLAGEVCISATNLAPRSVHQGGFFGTAALQLDAVAVSYAERVSATSGCIVLFVSKEHIRAMKAAFITLEESLTALERRLLDPKLAKASQLHLGNSGGDAVTGMRAKLRVACDHVFDPDSILVLAWETWLFIAMTVEWLFITFCICFGVSDAAIAIVDGLLIVIELHFVVDVFVQSHLGYYEFGNKVMTPKKIRKRYFRSQEFVIDLIALLPLFTVNWGLGQTQRTEVLNINKLFRLAKVPMQFTALENKYLKRTLELRLFKLVYYTFLLSHLFGCIWFDFASNASGIHSVIDGNAEVKSHPTSGFGSYSWMPPAYLENADHSLQYFASIFWSFGLMSASSPGELPKTVAQSIFSVITMTFGFFLFAYVIGNFTDMIELMDAENREFYAKLNSLRHLLSHFKLPTPIGEKFKNYFFFKRFHSITQEHLLERCLPPSLLTDIRMVHLQPMIDKVTFLSGMDASVTRMLVSQFNQVLIVKDEYVYKFGEEGSDMYFVFTGVLSTLMPHDEFARESSIIEANATFLRGNRDSTQEGSFMNSDATGTTKPKPELKTAGSSPRVILRAPTIRANNKAGSLKKLNEISEGSYFGENALFFNSIRTSYVQANTSCILYRLSRNSLELVFDRYPDWKQKVLRIVTINQEQQRLNRLADNEEKSATILSLLSQTNQLQIKPERSEPDQATLRRMKSVAAKRKASQSTRLLLAGGIDKLQEVGNKTLRLPKVLGEYIHGTNAQSWYHLAWLKLVSIATIYVSVVVPYRISFDSLLRDKWLPVFCRELELFCEILFVWDIWFNWRLRGSNDSMELYEQDHRSAYKKERLLWDLSAAFPLDYILYSLSPSPWYRINRCLKVRNLMHYLEEINRRSISNEMHRFLSACLMYILVIYWSACTYFVIAIYDHYGDEWNAWLPSTDLEITQSDNPPSQQLTLRLLRGLFFATTAFVKKGRTFIPDSTSHFIFTITTCFVGLLIMAFMLGEIASLFISYIGNEVEYRKNHIAVELYLGRWKIQGDLKARTQAFLSSLWSSHRGVDYQSLLEEVPPSVRTESVLNIARWPLRGFSDDVFRPLCRGNGDAPHAQQEHIEGLMQALARHLKFEGYPRNERVIVEGSISKAMYFVVRGHLRAASRSHAAEFANVSYVKGDYFGEKGLLGFSVSVFTVSTMRACDLLSLSAEDLLDVLHNHPVFSLALKLADKTSQELKMMPLANSVRTMELRWGQHLIDVIDREREACDQPCDNVVMRRELKKTRAVLDRNFVTRTTDKCYGSFRPFLQIIVPNGYVHLHGRSPDAPAIDSPSMKTPPKISFATLVLQRAREMAAADAAEAASATASPHISSSVPGTTTNSGPLAQITSTDTQGATSSQLASDRTRSRPALERQRDGSGRVSPVPEHKVVSSPSAAAIVQSYVEETVVGERTASPSGPEKPVLAELLQDHATMSID